MIGVGIALISVLRRPSKLGVSRQGCDLAAYEGQAIEAEVLPAHRACPPRHITHDLIGEPPDIVIGQ